MNVLASLVAAKSSQTLLSSSHSVTLLTAASFTSSAFQIYTATSFSTHTLYFSHRFSFSSVFLIFLFPHTKKKKKMVALKSESDRNEMDSSLHPASLKVKCVTSNGLMPSKQWQFVSLCTHFDVEYWDGLFGFAVVACYTIHCLRNIL